LVVCSAGKLKLMANAGVPRTKSSRWKWAAAIAVSLCANTLVAELFWELRVTPIYDSTPATVVQLAPRLTLPRYSSETAKRPPRRSARLAVRPDFARTPVPGAPASVVPTPPTAAPQPGGAGVANISGALRGMFGCDLAPLTDAERAACAERLAANVPRRPAPFNFDPHGLYVTDPEPYLTRKPKNGCKVMASGDTVKGQNGVAAGVGCAWSF
jgi:hypothetical protein